MSLKPLIVEARQTDALVARKLGWKEFPYLMGHFTPGIDWSARENHVRRISFVPPGEEMKSWNIREVPRFSTDLRAALDVAHERLLTLVPIAIYNQNHPELREGTWWAARRLGLNASTREIDNFNYGYGADIEIARRHLHPTLPLAVCAAILHEE